MKSKMMFRNFGCFRLINIKHKKAVRKHKTVSLIKEPVLIANKLQRLCANKPI